MNGKRVSVIIFTVTIVFLILLGPLDIFSHGYISETVGYDNIKAEDFLGYIDLGEGEYEIKFVPQKRHFAGVELNFINLPENKTGIVEISIRDLQGKTKGTEIVEISKINATEWYKVFFDTDLKVGKTYMLRIEAKGCEVFPYMQNVDKDYLGKESADSNLLIGYAYKESTFKFSEKVLISLFFIAILISALSTTLFRNTKNFWKLQGSALFIVLTILCSWNYMFNAFDIDNVNFGNFQADSEGLVTGIIEAQHQNVNIDRFGLGHYINKKGVSILGASYANDDNWVYGFSKDTPELLIANNEYTRKIAMPGNSILFSNGDIFKVEAYEEMGEDLVISIQTDKPLNYYKYGTLDKAQFFGKTMELFPLGEVQTYTSQFGLQGKIFTRIAGYLNYDKVIEYLQLLCSVMLSIIFVCISFLLYKKYNLLFAICFYITFLLSKWIVNFARNLYWVEFTWFMPMLVGLFCATYIRNKKCRIFSYIAAFVAITTKCLCGYEYLSTIMVGLIMFLITDLVIAIIQQDKKQMLLVFRTTFMLSLIALLGFLFALFLHANISGEGDIFTGIKYIVEEVVLRRTTGGDLNNFDPAFWPSINASSWEVFCTYFRFSTEIIVGMKGNLFPILCVSPICIFVYNYFKTKVDWNDVVLYMMCFAASISWILLAKPHSYVHVHINYVVWYFGYVQVCIYVVCKQVIRNLKKHTN